MITQWILYSPPPPGKEWQMLIIEVLCMLFSDLEITGWGGSNDVFLPVVFWISVFPECVWLRKLTEKRETPAVLGPR